MIAKFCKETDRLHFLMALGIGLSMLCFMTAPKMYLNGMKAYEKDQNDISYQNETIIECPQVLNISFANCTFIANFAKKNYGQDLLLTIVCSEYCSDFLQKITCFNIFKPFRDVDDKTLFS